MLKTISGTDATHDVQTDPISGDLFIGDPNGDDGESQFTRVSGQNTATPVVMKRWGDDGSDRSNGVAFSHDGTFFVQFICFQNYCSLIFSRVLLYRQLRW